MREMLSELQHYEKIFIGDFDSYTIIKYGLSVDHLLFITKVALLLFDRILMPAAFFWQSKEMNKLRCYVERPIEGGIILPVIRDYESTTDIQDYFERRMDESQKIGNIEVFKQPELASEIADSHHIKQVKALKKLGVYAHSDQTPVHESFRAAWKSDLENHSDINSIHLLLCQSRLTDEQIAKATLILLDESQHPQFSRASCIERVQQIIPSGHIQNLIKERTSWLYLHSNAISYNSKFYYSRNPYKGMVFEENLLLLLQTLDIFGITKEMLKQLSIAEILHLKSFPEYKEFIKAYREVLDAAYLRQNNIIEILRRKISWRVKQEHAILAIYKKLRFLQGCSSTIFLGLLVNYFSGSSINTPTFIASGTTALATSILKKISFINDHMQTAAFYNFKKFIIGEQYQQSLENHINNRYGVRVFNDV